MPAPSEALVYVLSAFSKHARSERPYPVSAFTMVARFAKANIARQESALLPPEISGIMTKIFGWRENHTIFSASSAAPFRRVVRNRLTRAPAKVTARRIVDRAFSLVGDPCLIEL